MPDASPWSPSAVRAALEAWEAHGQAGDSPEECMEAALAAAFPERWTEWGIRWNSGGVVLGLEARPENLPSKDTVLTRTVAATGYTEETSPDA